MKYECCDMNESYNVLESEAYKEALATKPLI